MNAGGQMKITQTRSAIGQNQKQRATLRGLGLTRIGRTVVRPDTPAIRGMVRVVQHLVTVESAE